jgi:hypothetical protein
MLGAVLSEGQVKAEVEVEEQDFGRRRCFGLVRSKPGSGVSVPGNRHRPPTGKEAGL